MLSDSDEDDFKSLGFCYWNDWIPKKSCSVKCNTEDEIPQDKLAIPGSCKAWLPPKSFGKRRKLQNCFPNETIVNSEKTVIAESVDPAHEWGPRMVSGSSYGNVEESELTWDFFPVGVFGNFKLERNNYGQIIAFADAEVCSGGGKAFIEITKDRHLRNLLGLTLEEWNALIEALGSDRFCLKYEALKQRPAKLSVGEQLWYFLCKRRHYLPVVAVRLRRNGVKKMAQFFDFFPKFRVEQIRTCDGKDLN